MVLVRQESLEWAARGILHERRQIGVALVSKVVRRARIVYLVNPVRHLIRGRQSN